MAIFDGQTWDDTREDWTTAASFISEGMCPRCRNPLTREESYGRCNTCSVGWRLRKAPPEDEWMGDMLIDEIVILDIDVPEAFPSRGLWRQS